MKLYPLPLNNFKIVLQMKDAYYDNFKIGTN